MVKTGRYSKRLFASSIIESLCDAHPGEDIDANRVFDESDAMIDIRGLSNADGCIACKEAAESECIAYLESSRVTRPGTPRTG
jgi:hypothetical protein